MGKRVVNNLTHDSIISTLADSDKPLPSRSIAKALGINHVGAVTSMLMDMVRDETLKRTTGGAYQLRDAGAYDAPVRSASLRREILQTDKVAIEASKRKRERVRKVDGVKPDDVVVEVMTLEKAEQAADEEKSVPAALYRLEKNLKAPHIVIPELPNAEMKEAMLYKLEQIMEDSIATECRELRAWMDEVFKIGRAD